MIEACGAKTHERSLGSKLTVGEALWIVPAAHRPGPCCRCCSPFSQIEVGGSVRIPDRRGVQRARTGPIQPKHSGIHPSGGQLMHKQIIGILASMAIVMAACGGATTTSAPPASTEPGASTEASAAPASDLADEQILHTDIHGEPPTLDPNKAQDSTSIAVLHALTRPLVFFDKDLNVVPRWPNRRKSRPTPRRSPSTCVTPSTATATRSSPATSCTAGSAWSTRAPRPRTPTSWPSRWCT